MASSDRREAEPRDAEEERLRREEAEAEEERGRPLTRELVEFELSGEGVRGEGAAVSGTLPDSVGGTTGTSGRSAGEQVPGSTAPGVRGIDPEKARRRVGRHRRREEAEESD